MEQWFFGLAVLVTLAILGWAVKRLEKHELVTRLLFALAPAPIVVSLFVIWQEIRLPVLFFVLAWAVVCFFAGWVPLHKKGRAHWTIVREDQPGGQALYLEVSNDGPAASFWATLKTKGRIVFNPHREVFARWDHTTAVRAHIPHLGSHRLRIAFRPFGPRVETLQWKIHYTTEGGAGDAMTWPVSLRDLANGTAEYSRATLDLSLFADPDPRGTPLTKTIRLSGLEVLEE